MRYLLFFLVIPLLAGCWVYGEGKTNGYITTIENGVFWDRVYIRAELESSQTDAYLLNKSNVQIKETLQIISDSKQRVQLQFKKHVFAAANDCSDEIFSCSLID